MTQEVVTAAAPAHYRTAFPKLTFTCKNLLSGFNLLDVRSMIPEDELACVISASRGFSGHAAAPTSHREVLP